MILVSGGGRPVTESIKTIRRGGSLNVVSVVLVCIFYCCYANLHAKTYVVFRYDDFFADAQELRENDKLRCSIWSAEKYVDSLFGRFKMPYTIAIVPSYNPDNFHLRWASRSDFNEETDSEKVEFIREGVAEGRIEVAQHGYSHTKRTAIRHQTGEFRERSYQSQFIDISRGKQLLEKALAMKIEIFVPPWNGWDANTGRILDVLDFSILSADRYFYYDTAKDLIHLPFTTTPQVLEERIEENRLPANGVFVVLYHPFELVREEDESSYLDSYYFGLERFEKLLGELALNPEVEVVTLKQLSSILKDDHFERYRNANRISKMRSFWRRILPRSCYPLNSSWDIYLNGKQYGRSLKTWGLTAFCLVAILFLLGWICGNTVLKRFGDRGLLIIDVIAMFVFASGIFAVSCLLNRGFHVTAIRLIPCIMTGGFMCSHIKRLFSVFMQQLNVGVQSHNLGE